MKTLIERQAIGSLRPSDLPDWLVSHGISTITTRECSHLFGVPIQEVPQRLVRARAKGQLISIARGLWAVVPAEQREMGAPEPMRYIDDLMRFYGRDYCVGWLSAAALQGASHQAPQVFQVATTGQVRDREIGRSNLEFHDRSYVAEVRKRTISTSAGTATVATAGTTMLMAMADPLLCGGLDNAATVVIELLEENDRCISDAIACAQLFPRTASCRLGWVLEQFAEVDGLDELAEWCQAGDELSMLSPNGPRGGKTSRRWNLLVNREVEPDL